MAATKKAKTKNTIGIDEIVRLRKSPNDEDQVLAARALADLTEDERLAFLYGIVRKESPDRLHEKIGVNSKTAAKKLVASATKKLGG